MRHTCISGLLWLACCGIVAAADTPGVWLNVPFVGQDKDGCGAASLAMIIQYWQQEKAIPANPSFDYSHIESALLSRSAHGIFASSMVQYLQQHGFSAFTFTGDPDLLEHHIA